jgi:hypothetical protein
MAQRYAEALARSSNQPALRRQQREWLRNVRDPCGDEACIQSAYQRRKERFEWTTTFGQKNELCEEFRVQINRRAGLAAYAVAEEEISHPDATHAIRKADVDGDKIDDQLLLFRTGSASLIPPDNSWLLLVLSSTGSEYKEEAGGLYVFRHKSFYYLLTSNFAGEEGPVAGDVHRLSRSGIAKVCSYECGLPDGNCVND